VGKTWENAWEVVEIVKLVKFWTFCLSPAISMASRTSLFPQSNHPASCAINMKWET
jgi:hypothetical protein